MFGCISNAIFFTKKAFDALDVNMSVLKINSVISSC